jgi:N-acetylglucosaminyldiphosphoundecaprenol N-acetyl-beta-D-mannosaminyltransferase
MTKIRKILGVSFSIGTASDLVRLSLRGGLVVVPSAPVLVDASKSSTLRQALEHADLAVPDSGLMILLWRLLTGERLERVSGLEYLKTLLAHPELKGSEGVFWVMPSAESLNRNLAWLGAHGFSSAREQSYIAPHYGPGYLKDENLLMEIKKRRPRHVIIALGGGVQERLGWFLRNEFGSLKPRYRPGIHCIGAAIGFLTGDQVRIPVWADYLYLGWLIRCFSSPRRFVPRYWRALRLISLMLRHRVASRLHRENAREDP